jgi:hypothetical protein
VDSIIHIANYLSLCFASVKLKRIDLNFKVLKNNIEFVVGMTGGVCGVIILMILPSLLIMSGRK